MAEENLCVCVCWGAWGVFVGRTPPDHLPRGVPDDWSVCVFFEVFLSACAEQVCVCRKGQERARKSRVEEK